MDNKSNLSKHLEEGKKYKGGEKRVGENKEKEDENAKEITASLFTLPYMLLVYLGSMPLSNLSLRLVF